jgi:hypothetical protein
MIGRRTLLSLPLTLRANASQAAEPKSSGPANGTLLIVGGGANSAAVIEAAQRHAGGADARWVVIPTTQADRELANSKVPQFASKAALRSFTRATAPPRIATPSWLLCWAR